MTDTLISVKMGLRYRLLHAFAALRRRLFGKTREEQVIDLAVSGIAREMDRKILEAMGVKHD